MSNEKMNRYSNNLSKMIQCETISPEQDGDILKFYRFHKLLKELYPYIHEKMTRKVIDGALLFKWSGKNSSTPPIILMAHMDVVPASGKWTYPPFSGVIEEGCIWGRGAVDTKGSLCAIFEAVEELIEKGFEPNCDIYIASSHTEEIIGDGAIKIVDYLKSNNIKPALVLDEGGAIIKNPMPGVSGKYAMLGIAEKGYGTVKFIAKDQGGHASTPGRDTPIVRLSKMICEIEGNSPFKSEITPPVREMFKQISQYSKEPYKTVYQSVDLLEPILKRALPKTNETLEAMLRTTCAFTMSKGSKRVNVLPQEASVTANLRFRIGEEREDAINLLRKIAAKYNVNVKVIQARNASNITDTRSKMYKYVTKCIGESFEGVKSIPYVMVGATDAIHYEKICNVVIRFSPLYLTNVQQNSIHAKNENLSSKALIDAVEFYKTFIKNY